METATAVLESPNAILGLAGTNCSFRDAMLEQYEQALGTYLASFRMLMYAVGDEEQASVLQKSAAAKSACDCMRSELRKHTCEHQCGELQI